MESYRKNQNRRVKFRTASERTELIKSFESSGLSRAKFCEANGIHVTTLGGWLRKGKVSKKPAITFFKASLPVSDPKVVEVSIPNGVKVRFSIGHEGQLELLRDILK